MEQTMSSQQTEQGPQMAKADIMKMSARLKVSDKKENAKWHKDGWEAGWKWVVSAATTRQLRLLANPDEEDCEYGDEAYLEWFFPWVGHGYLDTAEGFYRLVYPIGKYDRKDVAAFWKP